MKMLVCSVRDGAVMAFLPPFFTRSKGEAVRSFMEACNNREHQFNKHAHDYVLYHLGEFDDHSGMFVSIEPFRLLSGLECLADNPVSPPPKETPLGNGSFRTLPGQVD